MKSKMSLSSFSLKNFKAVQDSKTIRFTPLTVFIGNNGSGKSSIVEAMETFNSVVLNGLDEAMIPWHGFGHIWNKAKEHKTIKGKISNPMNGGQIFILDKSHQRIEARSRSIDNHPENRF